jgi:hypothetical protein
LNRGILSAPLADFSLLRNFAQLFITEHYVSRTRGAKGMEREDQDHGLEEAARMLDLTPETILRWMSLSGSAKPSAELAAKEAEACRTGGREEDLFWDEFGSRVVLISKSIILGMPEDEFVKRIRADKAYAMDFLKFLELLHELTPDKTLIRILLDLYHRQQPLPSADSLIHHQGENTDQGGET